MSDELDDTTSDIEKDEESIDEEVDEKDIDEMEPLEISSEDAEDLPEDAVVSPEEDPFGFGAFGELDEDGEYVAPATDDEDEAEDEVSEDLF